MIYLRLFEIKIRIKILIIGNLKEIKEEDK